MTNMLHTALNRARKGRILINAAILWLTLFAGVTFGQTYEVLHTFAGNNGTVGWDGNPDGANPAAPLIQALDGKFYGTTVNGSLTVTAPTGTVFVMDASGALTILHHFFPAGKEGANPYAGLIQAKDKNFYGTTWDTALGAGAQEGGIVFMIDALGGYSILQGFGDGSFGSGPFGGVIQATDGDFYGTTTRGGSGGPDCCISGTVFRMTASGGIVQLHPFQYSAYNSLKSGLLQALDGDLYGTTLYGPDPTGGGGFGTIFKVKRTFPAGFTMLHAFDYTHGSSPIAALIQATDGNFYGTTYFGGTFGQGICSTDGCGTVFRMDPAGTVTVLHSFEYTDGRNPRGVLLQGSDGNFYGTTENGGEFDYGTVFKMDAAGHVTTLHTFKPNAPIGGGHPWAGLIQAMDGKLYGTTYFGGSENKGVVFRLDVGLPPRSADLTITKSASPDPVTAGSSLTYSLAVTNGGPSSATDAAVTDVLPATVTFVSATPSQGSCSGTATITCSLGTLANGGSASVTIVVTPTQAGSISNTASVTANEIDPVSNNTADTTTHVVAAPVCTAAVAGVTVSVSPMFPLNHGFRTVTVSGVTSLVVTAICQDEDPNFEKILAYAVDGDGVGFSAARVRAEFSGTRARPSNGRVYHIFFTAGDGQGESCPGEVKVGVPTAPGGAAIDDGPKFDSITGLVCPSR